MKEVVIVSACRTAIGTFGGTFRDTHAADIAAFTIKGVLDRSGMDPSLIDDVRFGCCIEPRNSLNVSRVAALKAGIPEKVTAATVNRVCISGMEAVVSGMAMIRGEMADVILAGGVEHMSGVSYEAPGARWGFRLQDQVMTDGIMQALHSGSFLSPHPETGPVDATQPPLSRFVGKPYIMGHTAEFLAQHLGITREEMDEVALRSHNNAEQSTIEKKFAEEIIPVELPRRRKSSMIFKADEHFRPSLTMDELRRLPPVFVPDIGKVTAGNSSGINDGAAAILIMSAQKAEELGLKPLAKIKAVGRGGCHPSVMGLGPVFAVNNLSETSGLNIEDFELIEINEAFAAQYIACERELKIPREITNVNGSGIGLGHPIGCTGARIMVTLLYALKHTGKTLGLATLCGGGGVSLACALEML
jgi:acetyl-CoA C-acetyltransferase